MEERINIDGIWNRLRKKLEVSETEFAGKFYSAMRWNCIFALLAGMFFGWIEIAFIRQRGDGYLTFQEFQIIAVLWIAMVLLSLYMSYRRENQFIAEFDVERKIAKEQG